MASMRHPPALGSYLKALLSPAQPPPPKPPHPIPIYSPNRCFRCLASGHQVCHCCDLIRCKNCAGNGHRQYRCPMPIHRLLTPWRGRRSTRTLPSSLIPTPLSHRPHPVFHHRYRTPDADRHNKLSATLPYASPFPSHPCASTSPTPTSPTPTTCKTTTHLLPPSSPPSETHPFTTAYDPAHMMPSSSSAAPPRLSPSTYSDSMHLRALFLEPKNRQDSILGSARLHQ